MKDPCLCLKSLDINNEKHLKNILMRDKHARIEGLCTEAFFFEEILNGKFEKVTSGWWFGLKRNRYTVTKITSSVKCLTSIDFDLFEKFCLNDISVFIVEYSEVDGLFYYGRYELEARENFETCWKSMKRNYPANIHKASIPSINERNYLRLTQAIDYLSQKELLKKSAIERLFANCWLGSAYFWDIDFFVKYKGKFIAFEVKQKFPTAKGTWGLNSGLKNLFSYLSEINLEVVHVILVKPVNNASIPAIDLYTKEEYRSEAKWIATKFNGSKLTRATHKAPSYTSIYSTSELSYYHLENSLFSIIKNVTDSENKILEFLDAPSK